MEHKEFTSSSSAAALRTSPARLGQPAGSWQTAVEILDSRANAWGKAEPQPLQGSKGAPVLLTREPPGRGVWVRQDLCRPEESTSEGCWRTALSS